MRAEAVLNIGALLHLSIGSVAFVLTDTFIYRRAQHVSLSASCCGCCWCFPLVLEPHKQLLYRIWFERIDGRFPTWLCLVCFDSRATVIVFVFVLCICLWLFFRDTFLLFFVGVRQCSSQTVKCAKTLSTIKQRQQQNATKVVYVFFGVCSVKACEK